MSRRQAGEFAAGAGSPERLAAHGLLAPTLVEPLLAVRAHNPLLFEFALKRHLRDGSARLAGIVFDTRRLWA